VIADESQVNAGTGINLAASQLACDAPVIVLTMARSGSTLLRFILDSHPELTCPPEACLGSACFAVARLWDVLEPSAQLAEREPGPIRAAGLSDAAASSIRAVIDSAYGRYLERSGKRRWCDKSLDSIEVAELLADLYPGAQFICLYRHCLDVIVSAVEACPWGLSGYGFDSYAAASSGNSVAAVARCWLDRVKPIIDFQEKYPDRCHGIRYEDLVTAPEEVAASLFDYLGVDRVPGITTDCFAADHQLRGPADHKIWFTGHVNSDSLGQGSRVPVRMIPPEMLARVNQALDQLEYRQIDDRWLADPGPFDPRAGHEPGTAEPAGPAERDAEAEEAAGMLASRLTAAAGNLAADLATWPRAAGAPLPLTLAVRPARGTGATLGWTLSPDGDSLAIRERAESALSGGVVTATGATWLAILGEQANIATEQRAGRLRFTDPPASPDAPDAPPSAAADALRLLARLLGLTAKPRLEEPAGAPAVPAGVLVST
jgi:protein-tyrosine sulfotransferase